VHNGVPYVAAAIRSVLKQTYSDYEIIVVDDASSDDTVEFVKHLAGPIRCIRRTTCSGLPAVPRNEGAEAANGRYIAFLDADDSWKPEKLERQVQYMEQSPDTALVHTFCEVVNAEDEHVCVRREQEMAAHEDVYRELIVEGCFITLSSVMVRADVWREYGGFPIYPSLRQGEDWIAFLHIARGEEIDFIPEVLTCYRQRGDSVTGENLDLQAGLINAHQWLLKHPDMWRDPADRELIIAALRRTCVHFSYYWEDSVRYALHFLLIGMRTTGPTVTLMKRFVKLFLKGLVHGFGRKY
jgi:glycosyltransferase involved in cell wall biosynthesis